MLTRWAMASTAFAMMAGCLGATPTSGFEPLHFVSQDEEVAILLRPSVEYLASHGGTALAHQLHLSTGDRPDQHRVYHVDQDALVRRVVWPCFLYEIEKAHCRIASAEWHDAVRLAPFGFGWLEAFQAKSQLPALVTGSMRDTEGIQVLETTGIDPTNGAVRPGLVAELVYKQGPWPEVVRVGEDGFWQEWHRQGDNWPNQLPDLGASPAVSMPETRQGYQIFPGDDEDPFGLGYTAQDAVRALFELDEDARTMYEQGACVYSFGQDVRHAKSNAGPVWSTIVPRPQEIQIGLNLGHDTTIWTLERNPGPLAEQEYKIVESEESRDGSCPDDPDEPFVLMAEAWRQANATMGPHSGIDWFEFTREAVSLNGWSLPNYHFRLVPRHIDTTQPGTVSYHPWQVWLDARTGALSAITHEGEFIKSMDDRATNDE